jgi:hypothetical protein
MCRSSLDAMIVINIFNNIKGKDKSAMRKKLHIKSI